MAYHLRTAGTSRCSRWMGAGRRAAQGAAAARVAGGGHRGRRDGDRPRFELSEDRTLIRARYGHSGEVDLGYRPSQPPDLLFHGTAASTVPLVLVDGILRRGRRYVRLSETAATEWDVGARHGQPAVLRVAAGRMAADGRLLFRAAVGMWLADVVPPRYLTVEE